MADEKPPTKVDSIIEQLKNHPIAAWIVVAGVAILGIGQLAGAFKNIQDLVPRFSTSANLPSPQPTATSTPATAPRDSLNVSMRRLIDGIELTNNERVPIHSCGLMVPRAGTTVWKAEPTGNLGAGESVTIGWFLFKYNEWHDDEATLPASLGREASRVAVECYIGMTQDRKGSVSRKF